MQDMVDYARRNYDRVSVLLNRYHKRNTIGTKEVEDLIGAPVLMTFQNDYARITTSIAAGGAVDPSSDLGQQYTALSSYMLERKNRLPAAAGRRFVEYFRVSPAPFAMDQPAVR